MTSRPRPFPRTAYRLLAWVLPLSTTGLSILGDLNEEYQRRPAGLRRAIWLWIVTADVTVRYLPNRLSGVGFGADVVHALRVFRRQPALAVTATVSLCMSIGVATSAFSVINGTLLPLILSADPSVIHVWRGHANGATRTWPAAEVVAVRKHARFVTLETSAGIRMPIARVPTAAPSEENILVQFVSGRYLTTFDSGRSAGRILTPDDDATGAAPVAVLARHYWRTELGADLSVVGRTLWLQGIPVRIVGVAGRDFVDPSGWQPSLWVPLSSLERIRVQENQGGAAPELMAVGRIHAGVSHQQVEAELTGLVRSLGVVTPASRPATSARLAAAVSSDDMKVISTILGGVVLVVVLLLLVTSANVSNLQLASAVTRRREIAVRISLGASRWRVRRQLLTESFLLSSLAAAGGIVLAAWAAPPLAALVGMNSVDVGLDARVYAFAALAAAFVTVGTGLAPARYGARGHVSDCLKVAPHGATEAPSAGRARFGLVAVQAAASTIVVVLASLIVRAFIHVGWSDPGFDVDRLITVRAGVVDGPNKEAEAREIWAATVPRVLEMQGVESASLARYLPFGISMGDPDDILNNATDASYFATLGIRVVRGRTYTADEVAARAPVAVISERVARRYWGRDDPIGASGERIHKRWAAVRIIGVVGDVVSSGMHRTPIVYEPIRTPANAQLVIRLSDASATIGRVTAGLREVTVRTEMTSGLIADRFNDALRFPRRYAAIALALAAVVLGLSVVGMVGVTSFMARSRTRELGIRTALGARAGDVLRLLVHDSVRPVIAGMTLGLVAALIAGQALATFLYGTSGHDPLAIAAATAVIVSAALAAILLPAGRAVRSDPAKILRES